MRTKNRSLLLYHHLGSGKTITALSMGVELNKRYPKKRIFIITPSSLVSNFEKEAKKIGVDKEKTRLSIESYGVFVNKSKKYERTICDNSILIIDEIQNLNSASSVTFKHIYNCSQKAFKVILLSATPVKNNVSDITNTLKLLKGFSIPRSLVERYFMINSNRLKDKKFSELFKCNVSYYSNYHRLHYPNVTEHKIILRMSDNFYKEYYKIQEDIKVDLPEAFVEAKSLTVFLNGIRRAVNKTKHISPKIEWIIDKIISNMNTNRKTLVYSNWLDSGLHIIKSILNEAMVSYGEVTGSRSRDQKDRDINLFNNDKVNIILISASGSEGISLKGTRDVIILEPHWNRARIDQTIGRAIRFKSHLHLPEDERMVDIYYLILKKPEDGLIKDDRMLSADSILYKLSDDKDEDIQRLYKIMKKNSIENDKSCF